jgi:hypothetical protein
LLVCPNIRTQLDSCVIATKKRNKNPRHILCQFKPAAEAYVISLMAEEIAAAAQTAARRLRNKSRCMHLKYIAERYNKRMREFVYMCVCEMVNQSFDFSYLCTHSERWRAHACIVKS